MSAWTDNKCKQNELMQICGIHIEISHDNSIKIEYNLCFVDKAPFIRKTCSEQTLEKLFELVDHSPIKYCSKWFE